MERNILREENIYLAETHEIIVKKINDIEKVSNKKVDAIEQLKKDLQSSKKEMDKTEFASNIESVNTTIGLANESFKRLNQLRRAVQNPYFGRIDFVDKNNVKEKIYVGLCGIDENFKFYIYDWRTPIASLFYNYGVGEAKFETIDGDVYGDISLKRQFKFENKKIKHYFDTNINIDDPFLQDVLASASSDKMKNIVTTIQSEQNEVIRNTKDKILVVQGSAGSGKTSVALHRIAYLLYQKKDLNSNNIIIFSPNDVFSSYISNVLPELGENNVNEVTFNDFAKEYLRGFKKLENYIEFSERYYKNKTMNADEFNQIKIKLSDDFTSFIFDYIQREIATIYFTDDLILNRKNLNIVAFDDYTIDKDRLNMMFHERYSKVSFMNRLEKIAISISDELGISYKKYSKIIGRMLKEIINKKIDIKLLYNDIVSSELFFDKFGQFGNKINLNTKILKYEDITPLLYLTFEMTEYPSRSYIKQVVIDEAQDYTKTQIGIFSKVFSFADFTVLGDVNQSISPFYKYGQLDEIQSCFKTKVKYVELNKTYRSSYEIVSHNNKILGLNNSLAVRSGNCNPVLYKKDNQSNNFNCIYQNILELQKSGIIKIAIITKTYLEAEQIYDILKNIIDIEQINSKKINNLVVLPVSLAKGLEFDAVLVYSDEKNKYTKNDINLFYVACTRAQHELIIYNQDLLDTK